MMLRNNFGFAAVPLDVRKGCAFSSRFPKEEAMPRFIAKMRHSLKRFRNESRKGTAFPHIGGRSPKKYILRNIG